MNLETAFAHMQNLVRIRREKALPRHRRYRTADFDYRAAKESVHFEQNMGRMPRHLMIIDLDSITDVKMSRIGMMIHWEKQATVACYAMIRILRSDMIRLKEIKRICSYVLELVGTYGQDRMAIEARRNIISATAEQQSIMFELKFIR